MKKFIFTILAIIVIGFFGSSANAQMMGNLSNTTVDWNEIVEHTNSEEQEGKEFWNKFQAKEIACENLNDEQFGTLGEYFMGEMMGDSHPSMNAMMIQAHGRDGEEQIHIVMGKRLSGCDTSATFSNNLTNPEGVISRSLGAYNMMNFGLQPFIGFGWIFMILWWVLIIAGIIALIKWLINQSRGTHNQEKSPLEILKERYAKGEIDKKEFEEKKKDLDAA